MFGGFLLRFSHFWDSSLKKVWLHVIVVTKEICILIWNRLLTNLASRILWTPIWWVTYEYFSWGANWQPRSNWHQLRVSWWVPLLGHTPLSRQHTDLCFAYCCSGLSPSLAHKFQEQNITKIFLKTAETPPQNLKKRNLN